MNKTGLFFNILTFDWPIEPMTFYFSLEKTSNSHKLKNYHFPDNISNIFPDILEEEDPIIYTTFTEPEEGFLPLELIIKDIKLDLYKRFLNIQIDKHFRNKGFIVTKNFVKDRQIWVKSGKLSNEAYNVYHKYSLKIQFKKISDFPELIISYDGASKALNRSIINLSKVLNTSVYKKVIYNTRVYNYQKLDDNILQKIDLEKTFPLLNNNLNTALDINITPIKIKNRYIFFKRAADVFIKKYLLNSEFKNVISLNVNSFIPVPVKKIGYVNDACNDLVFKDNQIGRIPKTDFPTKKPYSKPKNQNNIEIFFIYHESHSDITKSLHSHLQKGTDRYYKGLYDFTLIPYNPNKDFFIKYQDIENPLTEIVQKLELFDFNSQITYAAIYISPFDKHTQSKKDRQVYYRVKEELLKRRIVSQVIDFNKLKQKITNYQFELNNISLALLAKLQGIPWQLKTTHGRELIVGVGAFKNIDENINYIASAFSFQNNGNFNQFDYFKKSDTKELSGAICNAISEFHAIEDNPDKVVIHFYKEMSRREMEPIITRMNQLDLGCPLYIININKTNSEDIIAFDKGWGDKLMPKSGTFIKIGWNQYLLFNNSRYSDNEYYPTGESFSFPIKLKISSPTPKALDNVKTNKQLIEQVYQFSRLYWKSLRQQNVPITIKYPEMVAEIAPHFKGDDIPPHGKDVLWFL